MELRLATWDDVEALAEVIAVSARSLGRSEYSAEQIEAALQGAFGVDSELIRDGTYFLVEDGNRIAACGGWSRREKPWGGDARSSGESRLLDPATEAARIRAFFVHPDFARRGLASRLLQACEEAALEAGFRRCELTATLPGLPFYSARGYVAEAPMEVPLGEQSITFVPMARQLC